MVYSGCLLDGSDGEVLAKYEFFYDESVIDREWIGLKSAAYNVDTNYITVSLNNNTLIFQDINQLNKVK
jgi:hypothetical protein